MACSLSTAARSVSWPVALCSTPGFQANKFCYIADKREFIKISQAVGTGFLIMGFIGYIVKLSMLLLQLE